MTYLQTTPVKATICLRCQWPILTGYAEGLHARVDPIAINHTGLIAAILTGRDTYRLTRTGLVHLDQDRMRTTSDSPILTAHKCGNPIPAEHRNTTTPETATAQQTEGIPF